MNIRGSKVIRTALLVGLVSGFVLAGCGTSEEGPAERTGKAIDEGAAKAAEATRNAASAAATATKDAAEATKDAAGAVKKDVEDEAKKHSPY